MESNTAVTTKSGSAEERFECLKLENQFCFPLYACAKEVVRQYRKPLEGLGLTYTQYLVMMALWEYGGMTEGELGRRIHLDSGTLTPLLKRLEKQGLINRVRPESNERKLYLSLTKKGERMKKDAASVAKTMQDCIDLPIDELILLKQLLDKALGKMKK